jgi:CheY-like chemotaxis protein
MKIKDRKPRVIIVSCKTSFYTPAADATSISVRDSIVSPMILVVDDDPIVLDQAQQMLNRERQVFLAEDSTRALDLAGNLGFSVALVDLDLPGGAGFDLIRTLRRSVPDLQIIAVTNAISSLSSEDAQKLGVVEVLRKPITPAWKPVVERIRARRRSQ